MNTPGSSGQAWFRLGGAAGLLCLCALLPAALFYYWHLPNNSGPRDTEPESSSALVVPTLDTPLPEDGSAIWCCTFQMAWDRFKNDIVGKPIRLRNAEPVADRLNRGEFSKDQLPEGTYYAMAGWNDDGVCDRIRADMKRLFPEEEVMDFNNIPGDFTAYAFLKAVLEFDKPYPINPKPFLFTSSSGTTTDVRSMGCFQYTHEGSQTWEQAKVLHSHREGRSSRPRSFAIDLSSRSRPTQLILAVLDRKATLQEMVDDLDQKIAAAALRGEDRPLEPTEKLLVPCLGGHLEHHFKELEQSDLLAVQVIDFRLDGKGFVVRSEAKIETKSEGPAEPPPPPLEFFFDRPFLVVLKKRDASQPFFVMWVDDADWLAKR